MTKHPIFADLIKRTISFSSWQWHHIIDEWTLIQNGFFYLGGGDSTQCYECGIVLHNWEAGDNVCLQHLLHSSDCPVAELNAKNNISCSELFTEIVKQFSKIKAEFVVFKTEIQKRRNNISFDEPDFVSFKSNFPADSQCDNANQN